MNDLTEKLKELLLWCVVNNEIGKPLFTVGPDSYCLSPAIADRIAKQLAPEIEKLMPRLIPVSERLPDEGQWIYVWEECANALVHYRGQKYLFFTFTHWMPIPKGPTK